MTSSDHDESPGRVLVVDDDLVIGRRQAAPDLPVAVLTAHPCLDYAVRALRDRADEFLQKSVPPEQLSILTLSRGARGGTEATRAGESQMAALALGATLFLDDLTDTRISEGDPTIGVISTVVESVRPTVICTHSPHDAHQDHRNTHRAAMVAVRNVQRVQPGWPAGQGQADPAEPAAPARARLEVPRVTP
jgi:hypothetical protein